MLTDPQGLHQLGSAVCSVPFGGVCSDGHRVHSLRFQVANNQLLRRKRLPVKPLKHDKHTGFNFNEIFWFQKFEDQMQIFLDVFVMDVF